MVFAAFLKLIIPFVVVIPGILAFNLYNTDLRAQAQIKNETAIAEFQAGEDMIFPFNEQFAEVEPDVF